MEETYEIRMRGSHGSRLTAESPRLAEIREGSETVLVGPLRDQSELHAVLALLDSVGDELIEVRRVSRPSGPSALVPRSRRS